MYNVLISFIFPQYVLRVVRKSTRCISLAVVVLQKEVQTCKINILFSGGSALFGFSLRVCDVMSLFRMCGGGLCQLRNVPSLCFTQLLYFNGKTFS